MLNAFATSYILLPWGYTICNNKVSCSLSLFFDSCINLLYISFCSSHNESYFSFSISHLITDSSTWEAVLLPFGMNVSTVVVRVPLAMAFSHKLSARFISFRNSGIRLKSSLVISFTIHHLSPAIRTVFRVLIN